MTEEKQVSRQRALQIRHNKAGLCALCSRPLNKYRIHCDFHAAKAREARRERRGTKAWQEGKRGRPPYTTMSAKDILKNSG